MSAFPNFKMIDDANFIVPNGSMHNIFAEPPKYEANTNAIKNIRITNQTNNTDMTFSASVSIPQNCSQCTIILKQTYDPNWRVTIDGVPVTPIITFPFYIGIPVPAGTHSILAKYEPARLKVFL